MRRSKKTDSLESLISDLIFKLGKAHQQISHLHERVHQLEQITYEQALTKQQILLKKH